MSNEVFQHILVMIITKQGLSLTNPLIGHLLYDRKDGSFPGPERNIQKDHRAGIPVRLVVVLR